MLRKYALVIFDNTDKIIDRYNIDISTSSSNNGFELEISTISDTLEDIITNVSQKKLKIKFTVQQIENSYAKANIIGSWIQKYSKPEYTMALEYNDTQIIRYCIGKVTSFGKTERSSINRLAQECVFTQTTPWFLKKENILIVQESNIGKKYPYNYPYSYGNSKVENNIIENPYIYEIPLTITIDGAISNPIISLVEVTYDDDNNKIEGDIYSSVKFEDLMVLNNQQLIIDSSRKKITLLTYSDTEKTKLIGQEDVTNLVSVDSDTFLKAMSGYSEIIYNRETIDDNFKITGTWRQYIL